MSKLWSTAPVFGLCVGLSAFAFQTCILYPWHEELSNQFNKLQVTNVLETTSLLLLCTSIIEHRFHCRMSL
jgi:hypothetical protein